MDFREESFLNGFSEGLEKVAKGKGAAVAKAGKKALSWIGRQTGATKTREALRRAGAQARAGTSMEARKGLHPKATLGKYVAGLRGKGVSKPHAKAARGALARLGVTGAAGAGTVGLGAALRKRGKD